MSMVTIHSGFFGISLVYSCGPVELRVLPFTLKKVLIWMILYDFSSREAYHSIIEHVIYWKEKKTHSFWLKSCEKKQINK